MTVKDQYTSSSEKNYVSAHFHADTIPFFTECKRNRVADGKTLPKLGHKNKQINKMNEPRNCDSEPMNFNEI